MKYIPLKIPDPTSLKGELVVTRGLDHSLYIYFGNGIAEFEKGFERSVKDLGKKYKEFLETGIHRCFLEQNGTILLPRYLHDFLGDGKETNFLQKDGFLMVKKR